MYQRRLERETKQGGHERPWAQGVHGYGNHGASRTLNSMVGWLVGGGSATEDVDLHGAC